MEEYCINCRHRGGKASGCQFNRDVQPNPHEHCPFDPPRWEPKELPAGAKYVTSYEVDPAPKRGRIFTRQEDIKHDGYSLAVLSGRKFYVKKGMTYTPDDKRELLGKIEDVALQIELEAKGFTKEQLEQTEKGRDYLGMLEEKISSKEKGRLMPPKPQEPTPYGWVEQTKEQNNGKEQTE